MTQRYLSLVLSEQSSQTKDSTNYYWSNIRSIHELRFFDGMVEITFLDGTIKVFNRDETTQMLDNSNDYIKDLLELDDLLSP